MNWESAWVLEWREVFGQVGKEGGECLFCYFDLPCLSKVCIRGLGGHEDCTIRQVLC